METTEVYKKHINYIIDTKAQGNSFQEMNCRMKLMLKGIPVKDILEGQSLSNHEGLMEKIHHAAKELNVTLPN